MVCRQQRRNKSCLTTSLFIYVTLCVCVCVRARGRQTWGTGLLFPDEGGQRLRKFELFPLRHVDTGPQFQVNLGRSHS